jgi:hypothetical protein
MSVRGSSDAVRVDTEQRRRSSMRPSGETVEQRVTGRSSVQQLTGHSAPVISAPVPQPGDVLVSRCSARSDVYAISVMPGPTQVIAGVHDQALETVRRFAQLHAVDGWYTCDHTHFVCVARHRSPRSHDGEECSASVADG